MNSSMLKDVNSWRRASGWKVMNDNIFENRDTYCVSCGKPMTSETNTIICPECQEYLKENSKENIDLFSKNISYSK